MRFSARALLRTSLLAAAAALLPALVSTSSRAQDDPPAQAGRLSSVSGSVSVQPIGSDNWGQAFVNLPLGPGDRIFTDSDGRAEIQVGRTFLRIGPNADVSFVAASPFGISFGVAAGSVHMHTLGLWPDQSVHVHTPSGSATLAQPGELRVDVLPDEESAIFTNLSDDALVSGAGGFRQDLGNGQALELIGSNPVYPQWLEAADPDRLDAWSQQRDQQIARAVSYRYVSAEIPGADELDANGIWLPGTNYGAIWFPNNLPAGWAPYHYGHWVSHAPWGWVWVEDEPWGYAPFHYGRWVSVAGRWGWVPGPPAAHPVWSPALVVFAGGIQSGGAGVSAWFPLGPGEPYRPWYPCSPHYIDDVNISNIAESAQIHIPHTYIGFNFGGAVFANRSIGVSAMRHDDFAAGRPVIQVSVVVDVHLFEHPQILAGPEPRPLPQAVVGPPPARPVPVRVERPVLINEQGKLIAAKPGVQPAEPPVRAAPAPKPLPGRKTMAPPPNAVKFQPAKTPPAPPAKPVPQLAPKPVAQPVTTPTAPPAPVSPVAPAAPKPGAIPVPPAPAKPVPPAPVSPAPPAPKAGTIPAPPAPAKPVPPAPVSPVAPAAPKPPERPAPPPTSKPAPPAPAPPPAAKPVPPPPTSPAAPPAAKPATQPPPPAAVKTAPQLAAKPPAKTDKDKKNETTTPK